MRKNLYDFRVFKTGLTLEQFADKIGLSKQGYISIENGKVSHPDTNTMKKLADSFDLEPEQVHELMIVSEEKNNKKEIPEWSKAKRKMF